MTIRRILPAFMAIFITFTLFFAYIDLMTSHPRALTADMAARPNSGIRNIILMIPDGTSIGGITLARWVKSYDAATGTVDPTVQLNMDSMASGLIRTWWTDGDIIGAVVDSAPAGTAMASGVKTNDNYIGIDVNRNPVDSVLHAAIRSGRSTGLIATSNIQHATPAAFSAHHYNRRAYYDIAAQQISAGIDVLMGGGRQFIDIDDARAAGFTYITTREEMKNHQKGRLLAMFADNAMPYDIDKVDEPSLAEMTHNAIRILSQNRRGFFLMVEGSKIDWAGHANDPVGLVSDILAFDRAVGVALEFAKNRRDTMVIVAPDHGTGGITMGNRDTCRNYSEMSVNQFVSPLARASMTGEGIVHKFDQGRTNLVHVVCEYYGICDLTPAEIAQIRAASDRDMNRTVGPMMSRRAYIGWTTHGHTGEDVQLFSYLPGGSRIVGTIENTDIARIISGIWRLRLNQ
ncbi:MAG: alkaline phosphatase [Alphaproteobacteria bacterium]|nr:alkaline phosphatase [Alphaproteobacteria bacterium]